MQCPIGDCEGTKFDDGSKDPRCLFHQRQDPETIEAAKAFVAWFHRFEKEPLRLVA